MDSAECRPEGPMRAEGESEAPKTIVGLGEVLWDLLPDGKKLGGAPANFAYHAALLGDRGIAASRVGDDELGAEIRTQFRELGLSLDCLQTDPEHPTGTVKVELDARGQPDYTIIENVAWDNLQWSPEWEALAGQTDAVCFGSLAQRSAVSRDTIARFLAGTRPGAVRIFDINLRQHYYSAEILRQSLEQATVVKLNDEELAAVLEALGLAAGNDLGAAQRLLAAFELELLCVTRGARGSWLLRHTESHEHPGIAVEVADTVGAGDAFTAALCHHYLKGAALETMNLAANRMGAWVASQAGATPPPDPAVLANII